MLTRGKAQALEQPKRFYKTAEAGPAEEAGFPVLLDTRPVRTPAGARLHLPSRALAELVAAEWAAQGEHIVMPDMPATRLAFTAHDFAAGARAPMAEALARYAGSDVLCYLAEGPAGLVARERAAWDPLLAWAKTALGLRLERAAGVIHRPQPAESLERARKLAAELDDFALTGLAAAAALCGSAVLALALHRGRLSGEEAFDLSRLDEAFQEEQWGIDAEAAARTEKMRAEARSLDRWFRALETA